MQFFREIITKLIDLDTALTGFEIGLTVFRAIFRKINTKLIDIDTALTGFNFELQVFRHLLKKLLQN